MLKFEQFKVAVYLIVVLFVMGLIASLTSNVSLVDRSMPASVVSPPIKVVSDSWKIAHKAGATIYRNGDQPTDWLPLDLLPAGKRFVLTNNNVSFATDDLVEIKRWYADLTHPVLDYSEWPDVQYVYEVKGVQLAQGVSSLPRLVVTIHEARTGCALPVCDPVNGLPNYDRSYEVNVSSMTFRPDGGGDA